MKTKNIVENAVVEVVSKYMDGQKVTIKDILNAALYPCVAEEIANQIKFLKEYHKSNF